MPKGLGFVKSLHIAVQCHSVTISRALIDNESPLKACPTMTLGMIVVAESTIRTNRMMVRPYNGTKSLAYGEIILKCVLGLVDLKFLLRW